MWLIFCRLLANSECFEELDIEDNLIGDMAGRELLEGLLDRKDGTSFIHSFIHSFPVDLPGVKIRTTHRLMADTFNDILKLGGGLKKKKKKGKKVRENS